MSKQTIHEYARRNMTQELRAALESGADPDELDEFRTTALQNAISEKNDVAAEILIDHGADITIQDSEGRTALHYAIEHGVPHLAALLLERNSKVVAIGDRHGNEPLWVAAFNARGNYDMVKLLMRYGADSWHQNRVKLSPLDIAKRKSDDLLRGILERSHVD